MKRSGVYLTDKQIEEQVDVFVYVRDEQCAPIGVVLLGKEGKYGWSLYNTNCEEEKASTDKGLLIALSRATTIGRIKEDIHHRVMEAAEYRFTKNLRLMAVLEAVAILRKSASARRRKESLYDLAIGRSTGSCLL